MTVHSSWEESAARFPLFFFFGIVLLAGCAETDVPGTVVARVNDKVLTLESIHERLNPSQALTQSDIQQYANRWAINEMLFQEAQRLGYNESDQIRQKMEEALKQLSIADLLEKEVYALAENSIRQNEIASYFQSHNAEFMLQENTVRLSVAIFRAIEPAHQFRASVLGDAGWKRSIDLFKADTVKGLLTSNDSIFYTQSSLYPPELWRVANVLGMMEVSFPVKTSVGYVVMQSIGYYKTGTNAPLAYVESQIRHRLVMERRQERYQQYIQSLRAKHAVQMMVAVQDTLSEK